MKRFSTIIFAFLLLACNRGGLELAQTSGSFSVEAAPYDNADASDTRSVYFSEEDQKLTNLNVWVYENSSGTLVNNATGYQTYFTSMSDIDGDLLFPQPDTKYDVYMFTNVGQLTPPANKAAADAYRYTFSSYDSFATNGFPMAAHHCFVPSDPNQSHRLLVQRLVSKYTVNFTFSGNYDFKLSSAKVCQSAKVVSPFSESKALTNSEVFKVLDQLSASELTSGTGTVYMLENIQGTVFSAGAVRNLNNIDPNAKFVTSFIEFEGSLNKSDGTGYERVTCRYYFGSGTYAGVKRNLNTTLDLNLTDEILEHDGWTVQPEEPYNNGFVMFSPFVTTPGTPGQMGQSALHMYGNNTWYEFQTRTYIYDEEDDFYNVCEEVKYYLDYASTNWNAANMTIQYQPIHSSSWANYTGQTLTGSCAWRVKSSYTGSTEKALTLSAGIVNLSNPEQLQIYVKRPIYLNMRFVADMNPLRPLVYTDEPSYNLEYKVEYRPTIGSDTGMKTYTGSFNSLTTSTASFEITDWSSVKGNIKVYINNRDYVANGITYRYPLGFESRSTLFPSIYKYYVNYTAPGSSSVYSLYTTDDYLSVTSIQKIGGSTYYDKPDWVELLDYDFPTSAFASYYPKLSDVTFGVDIWLYPCKQD